MMVDVHLRDGRTVLRFRTRGSFLAALKSDLATVDERRPTKCWRTYEIVVPGDGIVVRSSWEQTHCHALSKSSVSHVMDVPADEIEAFDAVERSAPARAAT